ncbi:phosphotransferase family protein [Streptomyces cinnamoneus]|uniref:Aminoglycoside phosphotransferase n=1 Tax=Streptomyces cinnamoneus TaxID=53446 RepID=A0A918WM14_STRCJ|nr:phosphotransferase family protein [Streptomyces cinnamoneus]GHC58158.1 aminoglycoside phosphotransferase [Streptomyces cinnamoneus]
MPVPLQRDPHRTREAITQWLADRFPAEGTPTIGALSTPDETGFSGETLLCDVKWNHQGRSLVRPLAVKVAPARHHLLPDSSWHRQVRLQELLATTDVPVARIHGSESSGELLGAPFVVMERIDGRVPGDIPSYHRSGWLTELRAADRAQVWNGGLQLMARLHRLGPDTLDLSFLDDPAHGRAYGPVGMRRQFGACMAHLEFYGVQDDPVVLRAADWLRDHRPEEPGPPRLLWGDARIGNIIYSGHTPVALLDWEMATLGAPESDLAWYLFTDRYLSEGLGLPRLPGLPGRRETVATYASLLGRPLRDFASYEVFAAFRFSLITSRVTRLMTGTGIQWPSGRTPYLRSAALLARVLDEAGEASCPG